MDFEAGYAQVNGARLYYELAGGGAPFVMIHAGIADSRMWDGEFEAFERESPGLALRYARLWPQPASRRRV